MNSGDHPSPSRLADSQLESATTTAEPSGALQISDLHHVAVACRDAQVSMAFYRDILGFQMLPRPPFDFPGAWLFAGNMQIHLIQSQPGTSIPSSKIDSRTYHLAFRVPCLEKAKQLLASNGVSFIERINAGGIHQLFIQDPDGLNIELTVTNDPQYGYQQPAHE